MIGLGVREILILLLSIFIIVLAVMSLFLPFFVYRIRNEVISINKKITEYIEEQKRRAYKKAG